MAITFRGTSGFGGGSGQSTSWATSTVASCATDDIAYACIALLEQSAGDIVTSVATNGTATVSGWTEIVNLFGSGTGYNQVSVWWTRVTAGGTLGATFTLSLSSAAACGIAVFIGGSTDANPHVTPVTNGGTGSPMTGTAITPAATGDWVVHVLGYMGAQDIVATASPAFVQRLEQRSALSDTTDRCTLHIETYETPSTSNVTAAPTTANSRNWRSGTFVLKLPGAAGSGARLLFRHYEG